ncbi:MAG TPA: hypothetical protein VEV15_07655 [Flavisolibacter sp.]|nr:hypothetical protein [Flavisolibacter sp.]
MNASQIHLALTHVPVILSFIGLVILIVSFFKKNETLTKTAFYIFLAAGLFTIPVYLTGESSEEIVEHLPGVSENLIERHEDMAGIALVIISISAIVSLAGLVVSRLPGLAKLIKLTVLFFALGSAAVMAQTAHLGGQIRHTEIRNGFVAQGGNENAGQENEENASTGQMINNADSLTNQNPDIKNKDNDD